jgi:hypothetical protein
MGPSAPAGVLRSFFALTLLFGVGGGCVAIYGFDDFEKNPPITCTAAEECPGTDTCGQRQCKNGICVLENPVASGALSINNKVGNCLRFICDGAGNEIIEMDPTNVRPDGDPCSVDLCVDGTAVNTRAPVGTQCGTNANVQCTDVGSCEGCTIPSDCGENSDCATWTCENGLCVKNLAPVGKEIDNPVKGDCKKNLCNNIGESPEVFAAEDAPSDEDPCTADYCSATGEILHDRLAEGTKCGDCMACTDQGLCQGCNGATSDCFAGNCVPKPKTCTLDTECDSKYCVDGYCCDSECKGECMSCDGANTGGLSGICAPIEAGKDPNTECLDNDVCRDGSCGCKNGIKDGNEVGVDCGGECTGCTGTWNCGGTTTCDGIGANVDCCYFCDCPNESGDCKTLEGQTCALGAGDIVFRVGTVSKSGCFGFPSCRTVRCKCE